MYEVLGSGSWRKRLHEILALGEIDVILRASVPDSNSQNIKRSLSQADRSAVPALLNDKTQFIDSYVRSSECVMCLALYLMSVLRMNQGDRCYPLDFSPMRAARTPTNPLTFWRRRV